MTVTSCAIPGHRGNRPGGSSVVFKSGLRPVWCSGLRAGELVDAHADNGSRSDFAFAISVQHKFGFLVADYGLRLIEAGETRVRYQSDRRFVGVYHDRFSYEVDVEVGRWVEVRGVRKEDRFPISHVLALVRRPKSLERARMATTAEQASRELHRLALLFAEHVTPMLLGTDSVFDEMGAANAARFTAYMEDMRASDLRARADEAWRRRDLVAVVLAYAEFERELTTVSLRPSERARLAYARKHGERPH